MYALWSEIPDEKTHLVLRSRTGRMFEIEQEQGLVSVNTIQKVVGKGKVEVKGRLGKADKSRIAEVEIKAQQATIYKPKSLKSFTGLEFAHSIVLYVVEVQEKVAEGLDIKEPLHWKLITDKPVNTLEQALEIVEIYKKRWNIEQLFRLTKQKGFGLEESQLETAHGLMNMIAMVFLAAVQELLFVKGRDNEELDGEDFFSPIEMEVMQKTIPELEGKTERSKNKRRKNSLAYFIWTIARLGGWKPEDGDPPGPITFKRGWQELHTMVKGYKLASIT